jgi:two-component system NtrC family response regulator
VARAIHERSGRSKGSFIKVNCAAIPASLLESELFGHEKGSFTGAVAQKIGRFELAHQGTLFLDEIGEMPITLQAKLLRFLQDQVVERIGGRTPIKVDVRVVSATNQPLEAQAEEGKFRGDLLYRLNSVTVRIPPLRERTGDTLLLARFFFNRQVKEFGRKLRGIDPQAAEAIAAHRWPGNVRELENRIRRAVLMSEGPLITVEDLELSRGAEASEQGFDLRAARMRVERELIDRALARSNGSLSAAARLLGISRPTLYGLLEAHGLSSSRQGNTSDVPTGADTA